MGKTIVRLRDEYYRVETIDGSFCDLDGIDFTSFADAQKAQCDMEGKPYPWLRGEV